MGLLDYYRQFDDMTESEVNEQLRAKRAREKALALEHVPMLDLSGTQWPELPNAEVVGASVYRARGSLNDYPDARATAVRRLLAEHHYIRADQIVVGNGALELIQTAAFLLLSPGDEIVMPWPSYIHYPTVAAHAGAELIRVPLADGAIDAVALARAIGPRTKILMLCNPNDPTGTFVRSEQLGALVSKLPAHTHVLLDEAFIQFQDAEAEDACLRLVEAFPRLLVFRTFSKIYGLSGVRGGYVVGSGSQAVLLEALAPPLGVNSLSQAAMAQALRVGAEDIERRRASVIEQRQRILARVAELGYDAPESKASFVWLQAPGLKGSELASRLERSRVLVTDGADFGEHEHVRAAIRDQRSADRLLWALEQALRN